MSSMELPLVFFTVLCQAAIGLTMLSAVRQSATAGGPSGKVLPEWIVAGVLFGVGLVAGLLHLGHPSGAVRTLSGLGSSWFSREILALIVLAALLVVSIVSVAKHAGKAALLTVTALVGLIALLVQGMTYAPPSLPALNNALPFIFFLLTAVILGSSLSSYFAPDNKQPMLTSVLAGSLVVGLVLYLVVPCVWISGGSVMEMTGRAYLASPLYWIRVVGGLALPLAILWLARGIPVWLPVWLIVGEIIGRTMFFSHVVSTAVNVGAPY